MKYDLADIFEDLVAKISPELQGEYDPATKKFMTCNTKWARVGKIVTDDKLFEYRITAVQVGEFVQVEADHSNVPEKILILPSPYSITGTKMSANREWTIADADVRKKTPLIWLLEVIRQTEYGRESSLDVEADLRIFFLDENDIAQFYTKEARENVVVPMNNLIDEFIKVINSDKSFKRILETERITFSRFGVEKQNGVFQNILDANLSGVELRITLKKYKRTCTICLT